MKEELNKEVRARTVGYISAALGLVAGLAWNDAISAMIMAVFPLARDTVLVKLLYAVVVTVAVVLLIKHIEKVLSDEK